MHGLSNDLYPLPTPEELRDLLRKHGLTGGAAGRLVGVDGRTIRKWTGGDRRMPWSAWTLLRILVADTTTAEVLARISKEDLPRDSEKWQE